MTLPIVEAKGPGGPEDELVCGTIKRLAADLILWTVWSCKKWQEILFNSYMEASEPKLANSILNIIGVNLLRLEGLYISKA